jgi:hypothetical protein
MGFGSPFPYPHEANPQPYWESQHSLASRIEHPDEFPGTSDNTRNEDIFPETPP